MNNKFIISSILLISILGITGLFFISHKFSAKETVLDEVKLKEEANNNESFAIMLEQDDGTYELSEVNTFPSNMAYNSELSGCIDDVGNKLDDALDFDRDNNLAYVTTSSTTYCYLYFDNYKNISEVCNSSDSLSSCITSSATKINNLWNSTLEDDGYRYVGTNPDNYICFGTSDKEECTTDTDKYMYRIIGIFEDENHNNHLKLIKKEALNTAYSWYSDNTIDVAWHESNLYKGITGDYFLTNTEYSYMQNEAWTNKISTWNYTMTNTRTYSNSGPHYYHVTTQQMYLHELNRSGKSLNVGTWTNLSTKISLMYASDYTLALGNTSLNYTSTLNRSTMKTGWMHINNNDSGAPHLFEWTMSRYGFDVNSYFAWLVHADGAVGHFYFVNKASVRPVFYLEPEVEYLSGLGTLEDPIVIAA